MTFLLSLYRYLRYNTLVTLLLGAVVGGTLENYIGNLMDRQGLLGPLQLLVLIVVVAMVYRGLLSLIKRILPSPLIALGERPSPRKGLLLFLGGGSRETALKALELHRPQLQYVWFAVTDRTDDIATDLKHILDGWHINCRNIPIEHHYNPAESAQVVHEAVSRAVNVLKFSRKDIICDVTGGTTAMTVGAVKGCLEQQIAMQMTPAQYDETLQRPSALETIELFFS